ncbi:MAG: hypothetical protein ACKO96_20105 [Flammeovirgaceae bacterium]
MWRCTPCWHRPAIAVEIPRASRGLKRIARCPDAAVRAGRPYFKHIVPLPEDDAWRKNTHRPSVHISYFCHLLNRKYVVSNQIQPGRSRRKMV